MTALNLIYLRGLIFGTRNSRSGSSLMVVVLKTAKDLVTIGCAPRPPPGPCDERTAHRAQPSAALNAGRSALGTYEWLSDGLSTVEKLYDLLRERRRLEAALADKLKAASRLEAWAADGVFRTRAFAATGIAVSAPSEAEPARMPRERTEAPPRVPSLQHSLTYKWSLSGAQHRARIRWYRSF